MAYEAWCDTAVSTKWWIIGTGSVVNRLSEIMDDNPAGVQEADNPGNFQPWANFMTEHVEDGLYQIHLNFEVGNGIVATTLTSENESVYFDDGFEVKTNSSATLTLGKLSGSWGINGSYWSLAPTGQMHIGFGAFVTVQIYASQLHIRNNGYIQFTGVNTYQLKNAVLSSEGAGFFFFAVGGAYTLELEDVYINNVKVGLYSAAEPGICNDVHIHEQTDGGSGAIYCNAAGVSAKNLRITDYTFCDIRTAAGGSTFEAIDPKSNIVAPVNNQATNWIKESYTCNIHIADKDGTDLAGVTVDCEDQFGTAVWAAGTITTNAAGDIVEQIITYKKWVGTSETETAYSPHKFTISKAGYETMVLDEITVDGKINWHLELLDELDEGDVRDGVAYGEDSEGNLELPAVGDVEAGVGFGSNGVEFTGDFEVPPEADVRDGEGYGAGGTEFEGDLDLPAIGDVEKGVQFDSLTKTGTFKSPTEADVRESEGYGAGDVEFTGTLDLPAEADVEDGVIFDGATKEGDFEAPAEADVEDGIGYGSNGAEFEGDLELPAEEDVRDGEGYGAGGVEFTGELDLPSINDVEKGVQFDSLTKTGTFKSPAEPDVRDGEGYGANDIEFEGELDLPAEADVRDGTLFDSLTKEGLLDLPSEDDVEDGVKYDNDTKEGNFEAPAEEDVEVGVGYGSLGTEFEGTYLGLRGNNLTAVLEKSVALTGYLEKKVSLTGELKS